VVPAGVDDDHVARAHHLARGLLQIVVGDRLPFLLGDRHHNAAAEKVRQRHFVDERGALYHMGGRVNVRGVVHAQGQALRKHARFRVVMDALDLDVLEIRPVGRLIAEAMGQVIELKSHAVVGVFFKWHAANCNHSRLPTAFAVPYIGTSALQFGQLRARARRPWALRDRPEGGRAP